MARDWEEYIDEFKIFLGATKIARSHNKPEIADMSCAGFRNAKMLLMLVGSTKTKMLFKHIGGVADADSWEEVLKKILEGIAGQTNQAKQSKEIEEITSSQGRSRNTVAKRKDEVKNQGEWTDANTANTHTRRPTGGIHNKGAGPGKKVKGHSGKQISHFKGETAG